jgi:tRNA G18 (ribose-2'-O)-methylase SpoU
MPVIRLDSLDDPRLADYRAVRDPELLHTRNLFVAEGRLVVERLLATHRYTIQSLLLSDAAYAALGPSLAPQPQSRSASPQPQASPCAPAPSPQSQASQPTAPSPPPIYLCRGADFLRLTGVDIHRGCLALVERPRPSGVDEVLEGSSIIVVLEGVANPDNVGGIFRNAAAFGVDAVILGPTSCDPFYRKAIRTSMAATLHVPFARMAPWPEGLLMLRDQGFEVAALTLRQPAQTLDDYAAAPRPRRLALLFGSEGAGLTSEAEGMADARVRIPIAAGVDSLNIVVAAGIALARLVARPKLPGLGGVN